MNGGGTLIKEFLVGLGFEVDDASLGQFSRGCADATLRAAALGAAVTAAATAVFYGVTKMAGALDELSDAAGILDETAEAIDRIGYAAGQNDSSVQAARASLEALNEVAGQAAMGLGRGKQYFDKLGISVKDGNGRLKSATVLMAELGDKIKDLDRGQQVGILKGLGIDRTMLATITGGLARVQAEVDEVYKAAGLDVNQAAADASDYMDELGRMTFLLGAMGKAVAHKFMGPIREGMARLRKTLLENMPRIIAVVTPIVDIILRIAGAFLALALRVASVAGVVIGWLARIQDATNGWAGVILAVAAAWKFLNLSFLASPLGMVLALAAAIALLVDDLMTFREGGDSAFNWSAWMPAIDAIIKAVTILGDILGNVFTMAFASVDALVSLLTGDFAGAWRAIQEHVQAFLGIFSKAWDLIKTIGNIPIFGGSDGADEGGRKLATKSLPGAAKKQPPGLTPSPQAAANVTAGDTSQVLQQETNIIVQGGPNADATARAVGGQQRGVNADLARNMKGAAR